ncbi:MAG: DUF4013 domain-containing protein [Methylacidiphilales bacterium]|nr:DUF4013 domain-containing protein [Candidatus Methylacidiphilales bacterium]
MQGFEDIKNGFTRILGDKNWPWKILLAGFLLINPFLLALAPSYFAGVGPDWVRPAFLGALAFNILSFWFPLGFTYEVLRRARTGKGKQLPDWNIHRLPRYAKEGSIKLILAITTLILPAALWMGLCYLVFIWLLDMPQALLPLFLPPIMLFVIPFCAVACCRWLDGASVLNCALNYKENWRMLNAGLPDYLITSAFLVGVNAVTTSLFFTIPFAAVFGLCLVDTWFGPIFARTAKRPVQKPKTRIPPRKRAR